MIERLKAALVALDESRDDVNECLNGLEHGKGYPKYDRRIAAYTEQLVKHDQSIIDLAAVIAEMEAGEPEVHEAKCPALIGDDCTCERHNPVTDSAWAQFCAGIGDGSKSPYPGMIGAFERYYGQSFADKEWRKETSVWASAWKAALVAQPKAEPDDDLVVALAEVRDLFPMPEHGSPIEREWAAAMADPCYVPDYVRACIAQPKAEPAGKIQMNFCTCWDETEKRYCARKGTCTTAIAAQVAQPKAEPCEAGAMCLMCPDRLAKAEPVRQPKEGDRVICVEDEDIGTVKFLYSNGSPYIAFDSGAYGDWSLEEFGKLFRYVETKAEPVRPQNCGTGFCSCIECVMDDPVQEPVRYEYRWLNPGNNPGDHCEAEWTLVEPRNPHMDTVQDRVTELEAYRYGGKPVYEVRALYAAAHQAKPMPLTDAQAHQALLDMADHIDGFGKGGETDAELSSECIRFILARVSAHGIASKDSKGDV